MGVAETQSGLLVFLGKAEAVWADLGILEDLYFGTEIHVSFKTI